MTNGATQPASNQPQQTVVAQPAQLAALEAGAPVALTDGRRAQPSPPPLLSSLSPLNQVVFGCAVATCCTRRHVRQTGRETLAKRGASRASRATRDRRAPCDARGHTNGLRLMRISILDEGSSLARTLVISGADLRVQLNWLGSDIGSAL